MPTVSALAMHAWSQAPRLGRQLARLSRPWLPRRRSGGGGRFAYEVEVAGRRGGRPVTETRTWGGGDPYALTGDVVAWAVAQLQACPLPPGVWVPGQVLDPTSFFAEAWT